MGPLVWILAALAGVAYAAKKQDVDEYVDEVVTENVSDYWTRFDSLFSKYGAKYGVDPKILKAISLNESNLGRHPSVARGLENPIDVDGSTSSDGKSWGLMQVTVVTARDYDALASPEKLNSPEYSVDLASRLLRDLQKRFETADPRYLEWVVKSYNQGAGNTNKERRGVSSGFAQEYWERFQRNFERVKQKPGGLA